MQMTYQQQEALHRAVRARIEEILTAHPLRDVETDYVAEIVLECHGAGGVTKQIPQAAAEYKWLLDFLESTSRISPAEHKALYRLYTLGISDIIMEVAQNDF